MDEELVKKKVELLALQKTKSDRLNGLLTGPSGFNEISRKTCKNLEAAITASKRPGYFPYFDPPEDAKNIIRSGEIKRLRDQILQLQKQIDQIDEKAQSLHQPPSSPSAGASASANANANAHANTSNSPMGSPQKSPLQDLNPNVHTLKQWFDTFGSPKQTSSDLYTSFTPDQKVYGGTSHYSAFRSQSKTMKKGRLTK